MKRIIIAGILCLLGASALYADNLPTEENYKDMAELRQKLVRMKREMDAFMKDIIKESAGQSGTALEGIGQDIKVDIAENENSFVVKADMPGMAKDRIDVTLANNRILKIAGTRDIMQKEERPGMVRQERSQSHVERTLELPSDCMSEGIKASYKEGVLEITIQKKVSAKESKVQVKVQ